MEHIFLTTFREHPDFNAQDELNEIKTHIQVNRSIQEFLRGELEPDVVLDMLDHFGFDPVQYVLEVTENLNLLVCQNIPWDNT